MRISDWSSDVCSSDLLQPGAAVFAGLEGTRPLLVEIQALASASPQATPRRAVVGWDSGRLAMVLAVLEARCGLALAGQEVYLNVAGGLRIGEPEADLAVAARSEEHTSELQSLMRISYDDFCLNKKKKL